MYRAISSESASQFERLLGRGSFFLCGLISEPNVRFGVPNSEGIAQYSSKPTAQRCRTCHWLVFRSHLITDLSTLSNHLGDDIMFRRRPSKKRMLYVDDEQHWHDHLRDAHGESWEIISRADLKSLKNTLDDMRQKGELPDLLLLDIYWPKADPDSPEVADARAKTDHALKNQVEPAIDRMNAEYLKCFAPSGLDWLREIRKTYAHHELPVVLYSSKGHFLLRQDDWLPRALKLEAEWLFKGVASPQAEALMFERAVREARGARPSWVELISDRRFVLSTLASALIGLALGFLQ